MKLQTISKKVFQKCLNQWVNHWNKSIKCQKKYFKRKSMFYSLFILVMLKIDLVLIRDFQNGLYEPLGVNKFLSGGNKSISVYKRLIQSLVFINPLLSGLNSVYTNLLWTNAILIFCKFVL